MSEKCGKDERKSVKIGCGRAAVTGTKVHIGHFPTGREDGSSRFIAGSQKTRLFHIGCWAVPSQEGERFSNLQAFVPGRSGDEGLFFAALELPWFIK